MVICQKDDLLRVVNKAAKGAKKATTITPMIRMIKTGNKLEVAGGSSMLTVVSSIPCEGDGEIKVACDAANLQSTVSRMPADTVKLSATATQLTVASGSAKVKLPVTEAVKAPIRDMNPMEDSKRHEVALEPLVINTAHALNFGTGDVRMSSFYLEMDKDVVKVTAIDGHRISIRETENGTELNGGVLVSGSELLDTVKMLDDKVVVSIKDSYLQLEDKETIASISTSSLTYYNVDSLFAAKGKEKIEVDRKELVAAIEVVDLFSTSANFRYSPGVLKVDAKDLGGESEIEIKIDSELTIHCCYSTKLMLDALKSITDDKVVLNFTNDRTPLVMRGNGYVEIVMPIAHH